MYDERCKKYFKHTRLQNDYKLHHSDSKGWWILIYLLIVLDKKVIGMPLDTKQMAMLIFCYKIWLLVFVPKGIFYWWILMKILMINIIHVILLKYLLPGNVVLWFSHFFKTVTHITMLTKTDKSTHSLESPSHLNLTLNLTIRKCEESAKRHKCR